jgi:periplasmic divalent cation tolerance protein
LRIADFGLGTVIVLTTLGANADAEGLARVLVTEGLAACVNILPVMRSVYRWQGAIHTDDERQLVIKTTAERLDALETRVQALHPYELPEWLVISADASDRYSDWLAGAI